MNARRALSLLGFLVGAGAVILQFSLTIPAYLAAGRNLPDALITFFSFFTIITNIGVVLTYLSDLTRWSGLAWFCSARTRGMMVGVMALVMIFYHFLLAANWSPEGLFKLADVLLHYVVPVLYMLWWALFARSGTLRFANIPMMLAPTFIYLIYILIRGAIVTEYPYPVLEVQKLGYAQVLINSAMVALGLAVLIAVTVAIDRLLARRKQV